jgi:hypothetical protein
MTPEYVSHTSLALGVPVQAADSIAAGDLVVFECHDTQILIRLWGPSVPATAPRYRAVPGAIAGTLRFVLVAPGLEASGNA